MMGGEHEHEHDDNNVDVSVRDGARLERGAGRGKLLFLDAFSGLAGDMLAAALVDLGVPVETLDEALGSLGLSGYRLQWSARRRHGIVGRHLCVVVESEQPSRDYAAIVAMLEAARGLTDGARATALRAFGFLAEAEAQVHATDLERVHFHEVGAVDSIVDTVAAACALDYLGAELVCSPLPMGRGFVRSQHGRIPAAAPATVICLQGVPTYDAGIEAELVTPTGACLVKAAARRFARWPSMRALHVGFGAGSKQLADRPNVLRVVLGEPADALVTASGLHVVLEANVDDMSGELAAVALARAMDAGALDTWSTPIGMKKGRPALMLSALAPQALTDAVARALLSESTSLGLRLRAVDRIERTRRVVEVQTIFGTIPVKVADGDGLPDNVAPEYEACQRAAGAHGVPVKQVYAAALAAYLTR